MLTLTNINTDDLQVGSDIKFILSNF